MKKETFDNILKSNNLSRKDFAELSGIKYTTVGKWNDDDRPIPAWVKSWLDNYIKAKDMDKVVEAVSPYVKGE